MTFNGPETRIPQGARAYDSRGEPSSVGESGDPQDERRPEQQPENRACKSVFDGLRNRCGASPGPHELIFYDRATKQEHHREYLNRRRMWVHAVYDEFDWGPDLGIRATLVWVYDSACGPVPGRSVELGYYPVGGGPTRWDSYPSEIVYAHGDIAEFPPGAHQFRSDFYYVGGPSVQPKPVGLAIEGFIPHLPPWEPEPEPEPPPDKEPDMLTDEQKEQIFHDLGVIVFRAYPGRVRSVEEAAQGIRQAWDQLQPHASASDLIAFSLAREGGATTDEVEAAAKAAVLLRRG